MRKIILAALFMTCFIRAGATHNRAGEITYRQISDLTYEITITTFTYTLSFADRQQLEVNWGDNSTSIAPRQSILFLPNYYKRNIYTIQHTYPGTGSLQDRCSGSEQKCECSEYSQFRKCRLFNLDDSYCKSFHRTQQYTCSVNPPYDKAARGYVFIHNPSAYDPDGDSLSYALTVCTREDGRQIENYTLPPATHSIKVDAVTGDLIWDTPRDTGKYNVAMEIQEWRFGKKIGIVERDMQIEVYDTKNKPPVNGPLHDLCVKVGDVVDFNVTATDPDNDPIGLKAASGIFTIQNCPATFTKVDSVRRIRYLKTSLDTMLRSCQESAIRYHNKIG